MSYVNSQKIRRAFYVAGILTGMFMVPEMPVDAANLMVTIPSNYSKSIMGTITGSRVTTMVDSAPQKVRGGLNGDPGVFNINVQGQSKIFLRQYTYSTSEGSLIANEILDADGDFNIANASGKLINVANPHGVAANGNYVYATGYDLGRISISRINGTTLTEINKNTPVKLLDDIKATKDDSTNEYTTQTRAHGEGIAIRGNDLYAIASVNKDGTYSNYDEGYLMHYIIKSDGTLEYKDYTRIGKNTDESRINMYNDHIFVSAIGGMQNYGAGNAETSITAATLTNGAVSKEKTKSITVPTRVKATGQDFRDLKILPNGTAYVMTYNLGTSGGIDTTIYQTTVSNLYATNPKDWTIVHSGTYDGWFGKLNAEMYTHRLWVEAGQNLLVYTDGNTSPKYTWAAKDFGDTDMFQYNFMAMLQPDTVYGDKATLTAVRAEGLTTPSVSVVARINPDAGFAHPTYTTQITGTNKDTAYYNNEDTEDYQSYMFMKDTVIQAGDTYATGDLTTNVLAAVDAHSGNDVTLNAGSKTLQLQSSHTIGSPSGIYAGNKKNVTVTAGKLNIITSGMTGGNSLTNGIWLDAPANGASSITIHAPTTNIAMTGGYGGNGIAIQKTDRWGEASGAAAGTNKITLDGDLNIKGADSATWGISLNPENVYSRFNNAGILTSVKNSEVEVKGWANMDVYGNGITVNAAGSKVSIGGGTIHVPSGRNYGYYTLGAYQGTINVNTGTVGTVPGTQKVQLNGDVFALSGAHINMILATSDSYLHGIVDNGGTVNMWLQNGAIWINEARNSRYAKDNEDVGSNGASHITTFVGGSTAANAGIINQKSDKAITIDNYSGNTTVNYGTMTKKGAGVTISAAAADSAMTVSGDRVGLTDREAMEALANKLTYTGYTEGERNLTGTVKVNEGLTTRSVVRTGLISFDEKTGTGSLGQVKSSVRTMAHMRAMYFAMPAMSVVNNEDGSTTYTSEDGTRTTVGSTETSMMKSVKSAMTTSMLAWRSGMTDMMQRMGDIRMGASDGIWARTYGGKAKYDKDHAYTSNSFWGAQVGADHVLASGWHIGAAFDYNDGDASYRYGGSGNPKQYLGSLYGTKTFEDGQYLDIVGKFGHTQNDYSVYNADGKKLDGKYSANGYGISLEYGKRFGSSHGYVEPQIQLSYSKLGSDDYTGSSNFAGNEKMFIHQDGMDSFIGRLGIAAGKTTERSSYYLKASVLHEFGGNISATYTSESNGSPTTIKQDFGDTWVELALGGTRKLGGSSLFYADITRSFGGDYEMQWKLNAGIRYAF